MSRAQNSIYHVTTQIPQGVLQTCRTQQLGVDSFVIDPGVLAILTQFLLDYVNRKNEVCRKKEVYATLDSSSPEEPALFDFSPIWRRGLSISPSAGKFAHSGLPTITWISILNIALGFGPSRSLQTLRQAAAAHLLSRNQLNLLRPAGASLFPVIPIHINQLIEAILHGDEKMVHDIINAAPELLLKKGTATDLLGRPFTGTPLQAAIATNDVAPNTNSTGMVEIILERLKQFKPDNYQNIFEEQARELYKNSLKVYVGMQEKEIARLHQLGRELPDNDPQHTGINEKIKKAQENLHAYAKALRSNELETLFKIHEKAQADNAFDFEPYVTAILDIDPNDPQLADVMALIDANKLAFSDFDENEIQILQQAANKMRAEETGEHTCVAKINSMRNQYHDKFSVREVRWLIQLADKTGQKDLSKSLQDKLKIKTANAIASTGVGSRESNDCRNKPFDQLTLIQKLNRFREKFVEHMKQEPIFNPNHILKGLKHNIDAWENIVVNIQDRHNRKHIVIFSQLVGWAQRNAAESMRQDIRQGTRYLTEKNERRNRQTWFADRDSSYQTVRLADVSLSDSLVLDGLGYKSACCGEGLLAAETRWDRDWVHFRFSKLISSKNSKLGEIYASICAQVRESQSVRSPVAS